MTDYRCPRCSAIASGDPASLVCPRCGFGQPTQQAPPRPAPQPASGWGHPAQPAGWGQPPPAQQAWGQGAPQQGWGQGQAAPGGGGGSGPSSDDRTMGLLVHVLGIVTGFLGPLILWLVKRDAPFVDRHGRAALDYYITLAIAMVAFWILFVAVVVTALLPLALVFIPLFFLGVIAVSIATIVFGIMGAMAANRGEEYRYPIAIRMLSKGA